MGWIFSLIFIELSLFICAPLSIALTKTDEPQSVNAAALRSTLADTDKIAQISDRLKTALDNYHNSATVQNWQEVWSTFNQLLAECAKNLNPEPFEKSVPQLRNIGCDFIESGNVKVWSFPKNTECDEILVMWKDVISHKPTKVGKRTKRLQRVAPPTVITHLQALAAPATTSVDGLRLLSPSGEGSSPSKSLPKTRLLVLVGTEHKDGTIWLQGYRLAAGRWVVAPELFEGLPPFLTQNLKGKLTFNQNKIIVSLSAIDSTGGKEDEPNGEYKLALDFVGGQYRLSNQAGLEGAASVAWQFLQAVQAGRVDLVKSWLANPRLASIPGYLGLYSRTEHAAPFKLVPMAGPPAGSTCRFRAITYGTDDLILDVGKVKAQWAIKGIFIAPADPFAKKIAGY